MNNEQPHNARSEYVVAIDVGGTAIKAGLWDRDGRRARWETLPTKPEQGPTAVVDRILTLARVLPERGAGVGVNIHALGIAITGAIDEANGIVVSSDNLGWRKIPLRTLLADALRVPVTVGHDVRLAAFAEALIGAGRDCSDFLFITFGTDIGGACIVNGDVYRGAHGKAGELGHVVVDPDGASCVCGGRGCLATVSSVRAIERYYVTLGGEPLSAREIVSRAGQHDVLARAVWDKAVGGLAKVIYDYAVTFDPDRIIIGGGLSHVGPTLFDPLRARLAVTPHWAHPVHVIPAALGNQAGAVGAAMRAWLDLGMERERLVANTARWMGDET